jgi:transcriptional regulator with XRE-family HTH domain
VRGDDAYGATVAKRRLSQRLAALRKRSGLSVNEATDKLGWRRGRIGRIEGNDWRLPEASFIRDMARIYGASEEESAELEDLTRRASARPWWRSYEDVFGKNNEFPGFESDATKISVYMPLVIPGLLQTPAYIETQMRLGRRPEQWRERALEARLRRQQILDRTDGTAPRLSAVITEASLLYRWGTQDDRRAQAAHLAAMSRRPHVELRLLRFVGGHHPGMISQINLFDFPDDDDPSVVYLENEIAIQQVTKPADVKNYTTIFTQIRDAALPPTATTTHLEKLTKSQR